MGTTKIEWADAVWNPVTGCTKVSAGCAHCYAERMVGRFNGGDFGVRLHPGRLDEPLHWHKPRRVFVCSMGDLFHEDVPEPFVRAVFATMALCPQHTFMILTKRPQRMSTILGMWAAEGLTLREGCGAVLPNAWLGVSVENQAAADERIPLLLQTPAAVRFVSVEPMLGPVDLRNIPFPGSLLRICDSLTCGTKSPTPWNIKWVICGGESGPGARPMHPEWARSLRCQCSEAGVPFFFKQMAKKAEIPADLRIREFPCAR